MAAKFVPYLLTDRQKQNNASVSVSEPSKTHSSHDDFLLFLALMMAMMRRTFDHITMIQE
jgi:hypothetical protein